MSAIWSLWGENRTYRRHRKTIAIGPYTTFGAYPRLRKIVIALAERFKPSAVLIEDASTGVALAQELRGVLSYPVKPVPVERNKVGRLYVQQAKFEAGLVLFPKGASFLPELEAELLTFPQGKTDDQVDSISQALAYQTGGYDRTLSWVG